MPSKFFDRFPRVSYDILGDGNKRSVPNISYAISISQESEEEVVAYTKYIIKDGDRPDTVSQELYGSPNYFWTFYILNDNLREYGWPPGRRGMSSWIEDHYPGWRLQVNADDAKTLSNKFILGEVVKGEGNNEKAKVVKKETVIEKSGEITGDSYIEVEIDDKSVDDKDIRYNGQRWVGQTSGDAVEEVKPVKVINWKTRGKMSIYEVEMERHKNYYTQIKIIRPEHIRLVSSLYSRL